MLWKYGDCYYGGRKLNVESGSEAMIKPLRQLRRLLSALLLGGETTGLSPKGGSRRLY